MHVNQVRICISGQQYSVSERQMSEMSLREGGIPFQLQSLTVVPLNIYWHPGTSSGQVTAHGWHIIYGWNMIYWYPAWFYALNACVGVDYALDLSKNLSSVPGDVNTVRCYAPCAKPGSHLFQLKNRCWDMVTFASLQSLIRHSPVSGCRACCGLWNKALGMAFDWERPLM